MTGEGLSQALENTEIVIDLSNSSAPEEDNAIRFFQTAGKNLVKAERFTGKERAALSIIDDIGNKSTVLSS
ncbi:hypothetical protein [Sphingobacterium thalpophilum]|uniref:hypothetical protein n=1 Tax=Sphingobacterium thalpophilum TaxID=259 RepID=UPI0024A77354|nr:hypothetical protein [Sphingobacterium thalpophilum]